MTRNIIGITIFFVISCNFPNRKKEEIVIIDSSGLNPLKKNENEIKTDTFNIEKIMPSYLKDSNFNKISGLEVRAGLQKTYYYGIYKMPKKIVLNIYNKLPQRILVMLTKGKNIYSKIKKIENTRFWEQLYEKEENNKFSQDYFYKFRYLKDIEIFEYNTPEYFQQLIFDKNSDTVYHRVREVIF